MRLPLRPQRLAVLTLASVWLGAAVPAAEASFPGRNGLIAFAGEGPPFNEFRQGALTIRGVDPRSGRMRQLTHVPRRCGRDGWAWADTDPSFSASGRLLTYLHIGDCDPRTPEGIYVMDVESGRRSLIRREGGEESLERPAFSPSGELLAFDDYLERTFVTHVRPPHRGRELRIRSGRGRYLTIVHPTWSSGGKLALTLSDDLVVGAGHIGTVTAKGGGRVRLVTRSRRDAMPDWSPTADRIVFHRLTERGRRGLVLDANVFVAPVRSHGKRRPRRLTRSLDAFFPVWSPNGRRIAYFRSSDYVDNEYNKGSLWTMRASDGGGQRLIATGLIAGRIGWQPRPRR